MTMSRLGNPFVRALLGSPLHGLLSGSLILVTYTGRKTGRTFAIPVLYAGDTEELVVYVRHSPEKVWWRNLRGGAPVRVRVRGEMFAGTGTVISGHPQVRERYLARFPRAAKALAADPSPVFVRVDDLTPA